MFIKVISIYFLFGFFLQNWNITSFLCPLVWFIVTMIEFLWMLGQSSPDTLVHTREKHHRTTVNSNKFWVLASNSASTYWTVSRYNHGHVFFSVNGISHIGFLLVWEILGSETKGRKNRSRSCLKTEKGPPACNKLTLNCQWAIMYWFLYIYIYISFHHLRQLKT